MLIFAYFYAFAHMHMYFHRVPITTLLYFVLILEESTLLIHNYFNGYIIALQIVIINHFSIRLFCCCYQQHDKI